MTKTPKELAEEYAQFGKSDVPNSVFKSQKIAEQKFDFLAGYQAAKDQQRKEWETLVSKGKIAMQTLNDQLADADKVIPDTCEHILHMEKMVDVSSSVTLNNWISVKDRLPEIKNRMSEHVLILDEYGKMSVEPFEIVNNEIVVDWGEAGTRPLSDFSHWQPLPKPPTE